MMKKFYSLLWSTRVALFLLTLIFFSCVIGVLLPSSVGKEAVFTSLWFNLLLVLLIVNIVFCILKRTKFLLLSQVGTTIFHLGLVVLFIGVVYDQLFFFEGTIRLTEGETLSCAERPSYDRVKVGRFFQIRKLGELGPLYFHKLHISYTEDGKDRGIADEISLGQDLRKGRNRFLYVARPFAYKGFELYRNETDGYSPLFVLRDRQGKVLVGHYAPLQSIMQQDGTYLYTSGSFQAPGRFDFPQDPRLSPVFQLQTVYHPDKINKRTGDVSFQIWKAKPDNRGTFEELLNGKAAFGERVKVGEYMLSMDEVRYWTSMTLIYRPGLKIIFSSFWIALGD